MSHRGGRIVSEPFRSICGARRQVGFHQLKVDAVWIVRAFHQTGRRAGNDHYLCYARATVPRQVPHDLARASRVRHEREIAEIQLVEQYAEIVGERVVVVTVP